MCSWLGGWFHLSGELPFDHDVPDEFRFSLESLGHVVTRLRFVLPPDSTDAAVLVHAAEEKLVLVSCNRLDFLELAKNAPHHGIILLFRRRTRLAERAALIQLVTQAGEPGIVGNINFA
ncbi:MAG: DUF5615 family PIN-like protein [bacterium]